MSSNKTLKKFCKLSKYIEQVDRGLFEVFDDLCIVHLLKPQRGAAGITMLLPKEKAYRQKIINAAYSGKPELAVDMIKALILQDYYPTLASFKDKAVNLLNQKLVIDSATDKAIKLKGGLEIVPDKKFVPMGYRENMTVYSLTGKGEIPLNSPVVAMEARPLKSGGRDDGLSITRLIKSILPDHGKSALQKHLAETYSREIGVDLNIYTKKVYFHLKNLLFHKVSPSSIHDFLGNDEFSDSYLLDMYCEKNCPGCFTEIMAALKQTGVSTDLATKENYHKMKENFVDPEGNNKDVKDPQRMTNIASPREIREKVFELYGDDKDKIGKDLFIVFCNLSRNDWSTDANPQSSFQNFVYLVSNVFTSKRDMIRQPCDIPAELTLYGTLLKSDVFKYVPQARFTTVPLPIPGTSPTPVDMKFFSLCGFINKPRVVTGQGSNSNDASLSYLLSDL